MSAVFPNRWYPNVISVDNSQEGLPVEVLRPDQTADAIRRLYDMLYALKDSVQGGNSSTNVNSVTVNTGIVRYSGPLAFMFALTLKVKDAGTEYWATDYDHIYVWSGTAWGPGPDEQWNYINWYTGSPTTGRWQICDGSTVTSSTKTGILTIVTVPNLDGVYIKGGLIYTGPVATPAIAPGLTGTPDLTGSPSLTGSPALTGSITGTVSGTLADHTHTIGTDNIGAGSIFVSSGKSTESGHVGDPWAPTATIGGTGTVGGSASVGGHGVMPDHTHGFVSRDVGTSGALLSGGGAWHVTGTVTGQCPVALHNHSLTDLHVSGSSTSSVSVAHTHGLSTVSATGLATDTTSVDHIHTVLNFDVHSPSSGVSIGVPNGTAQNVEDSTAFNSHVHATGNFDTEGMGSSDPHDHTFDVDFSAFSTDTSSSTSHSHTFGVDFSALDTGSTAVTPGDALVSGVYHETNADHLHTVNFGADPTLFTGSVHETGTGRYVDVSAVTVDISGITVSASGLTWSPDSTFSHFHVLTGHTDSVIGTITQTSTFTYTGNLDVGIGSLAATIGSLDVTLGDMAVDTAGQPIHMALLPYFRL